jgi:hypothetical protein
VDNGTILLSESSGSMDILASGMIESRGGGGLGQGLFLFLELYGSHEFVDRLAALPVAFVGALDISPDGDDTMQSWHL